MRKVLSLSLITSQLVAGGLYFEEYATQRMGAAGAGNSVVTRDASIAFHNPAGMTHLKGNNLSVGLGVVDISAKFSVDPASPTSGNSGGDQGDILPVASLFYTHSYSDELKFGLAVTSRMALALDPNDDWAGRYQVQELDALSLIVNPSVAYKVNDKLSLGFGLLIEYMQIELDMAIPSVIPTPPTDGQINADIDDTALGFNLGLIYDLSDNTRIGLTYWSETEHKLTGDITVTPAFNPANPVSPLNTDLTMPQRASLGLQQVITDKFTLLADIAWEDWSTMDANVLNNTVVIPRDWDDTWHFALGMNYTLNEKWLLQAGVSHDTSPDNARDRRADMAVDKQMRYALGAEYNYNDDINLGISYQYTDLGDAAIDNDPAAPGALKGEYSSYSLNTLLFTANWKF